MKPVTPRRDESAPYDAKRTEAVIDRMAALVSSFRAPGGRFIAVHPGRWRDTITGHHVETGYSYGEGRLRVFLGGGRAADADFVVSGRDDDPSPDKFDKLFPVSS